MPDATLQDSPADYATIAVRADHWAAIQGFIDVQRSAVKATDPQERDASKQLEKILSIIDKYNTAQDTVEVTVDLGDGQVQNVLVSRDSLSFEIRPGTVSSTDNNTKLKVQRPHV